MNNTDIRAAIEQLAQIDHDLDRAFEESGGELTEELQARMDQRENIKALLQGEGIDDLGRWLKSVEDRKAALKAERDTIARRIKSCDNTLSYIKGQIRLVMDALGIEKAKGTLYSFTASNSGRSTIDGELIDKQWLDVVTQAARAAGLPEYLDVVIDTSITRLSDWADAHDGEGAEYLNVENTPTVTFRKPKANKETK